MQIKIIRFLFISFSLCDKCATPNSQSQTRGFLGIGLDSIQSSASHWRCFEADLWTFHRFCSTQILSLRTFWAVSLWAELRRSSKDSQTRFCMYSCQWSDQIVSNVRYSYDLDLNCHFLWIKCWNLKRI